ncbi:ABC transporter permease [Micromonospora aurantiaca]|uniref:ABC transporter permease n=2 Tax=Micromonospora TaxID=1873 RepID=A0AAW4JU11_9ACTN|nr:MULTISPECIES: ABC transporter permease [Micromonospora]ADL48593.1 binding-protein-dependent transport systems inner membrane component [Micromonospora aurantiaca ATCC 27029]ADU08742.1 binding-protein-dependent transport systems inner membrane component [Micromonospora sp. L5]AXH88741.1 ABC transporter permease [Micromonospora aurantiaca]KAB1112654.1 ABC transporter permease [Micromonospora aurantiaca]KAB1904890.1 ABC transporter permease [Micromonospora sp. AMSO1212t]
MTSVADAPPDATADVVAAGPVKPRRRWNLTLVIGAGLVGLVVLTALVSFLWTPYDPTRVDPSQTLLSPGGDHWLGTDHFGRDIVSQLLVGARTTLFVGVVAVAIAAAVGVPLGLLAATGHRWLSEPVMRALDIVFAFPAILLAIILAAGFGASTLTGMIAIGVANVPVFGRLTRAGAMQVLQSDFVLAARSYGRRGVVLMVRYVLPNIAALLIVQASVSFAHAVLAEAALSYLGYGTPPPTPTWGRMLQEAQNYFVVQPMLAVWPGLAIALSVLGFNLMGDGLRDALDPRLRGR